MLLYLLRYYYICTIICQIYNNNNTICSLENVFLAKYFRKKLFRKKKLQEYFPVRFNFHPTSCPSIDELSLFLYNLELIAAPSLFFL